MSAAPKQKLIILGATGSIGTSAMAVLRAHPQLFQLVGMSAYQNSQALQQLAAEFNCSRCWLLCQDSQADMLAYLRAAEVDSVLVAISGAAALLPTLAAIKGSKRVLLANKEVMVMAGALIKAEAQRHGCELIPVDSEHSAVLQCWPQALAGEAQVARSVEQITLTASGGPFWQSPLEQLSEVSVEQACAHPQWRMGAKISVDSATMMNKALEVIEAGRLFDLSVEAIKVLIHPQSIVHALVRYCDGAEIAQLSPPDMRTAIAYALAYPQRLPLPTARLDLARLARLDFYPVDYQRFPALRLGYQALASANSAAIVFNAANEIAVSAFLRRAIKFTDILPLVERSLDQIASSPCTELDDILAVDRQAREQTQAMLER